MSRENTSYKLKLGGNSSRADALHKIHSWAPKRARSFTLQGIKRYYYTISGRRDTFVFEVVYHDVAATGKYRLGDWSWNRFCLRGERFNLHKNTAPATPV